MHHGSTNGTSPLDRALASLSLSTHSPPHAPHDRPAPLPLSAPLPPRRTAPPPGGSSPVATRPPRRHRRAERAMQRDQQTRGQRQHSDNQECQHDSTGRAGYNGRVALSGRVIEAPTQLRFLRGALLACPCGCWPRPALSLEEQHRQCIVMVEGETDARLLLPAPMARCDPSCVVMRSVCSWSCSCRAPQSRDSARDIAGTAGGGAARRTGTWDRGRTMRSDAICGAATRSPPVLICPWHASLLCRSRRSRS
jgi:hypothetical protein